MNNLKHGRNDPCLCGSGKKYKKCCLNNATESTVLSYGWRKSRVTDGELAEPLLQHALKLFGKQGLECAWDEFYGYSENTPEINAEQMVFEQAFMPWFLYNWCPDPHDELIADLPVIIAAEDYLTRRGYKLDNYQKLFIKTNVASQYSLYEVTHVVPQQSLTLKDILRGEYITIHEKRGSETLTKGLVLMARIITLNDDSIACGMYPMSLPSQCLLSIVEFKQHYSKDKFFTDQMVSDRNIEIRSCFINMVQSLLDNPFPQLQNTDGEDLSIATIHYSLTCTPQRAFDALTDLTAGISKSELAQDGIYDAKHQLLEISFPWCKEGNSVHKDWKNTVYGHIAIKKGSLTIEVNSAERARSIIIEIEARLHKHEATYHYTEEKSIQEMLAESQVDASNPSIDSPEIKLMLEQLSQKNWVAWLDTSVPALADLTPREAAKTTIGRERLEALFVDFHQKNQAGFSDYPVDLHFLRQELDML